MSIREQLRRRMPSAINTVKRIPAVEGWLDRHPPREPHVERAIRGCVGPGDTVVDVGAHRGTLTRLLASLVGPSGTVLAFDANPSNAAALESMFAKSSQVSVKHAAVSDVPGRVHLFPGRGGRSAEWNIDDHLETGAAIDVPAITLDAYFDGPGSPTLIKIDVEGAEARVLRGMANLLREKRPALVIEFHDRGGRDAVNVLHELGYKVEDLATGEVVTGEPPRYFHGLATASTADNARPPRAEQST